MNKEEKESKARGAKFRLEKLNALYQSDIIAHMQKMGEMESARRKYFYFCSKLWKAIEKHITYEVDCVLIEREADVVVHNSGSSVSLKETHLYSGEWTHPEKGLGVLVEATVFSMEIEVTFCPKDEQDRDDPSFYRKSYYLQPPIELERNFTEKAFDKWIDGLKKERQGS
jgi:hypothetical protein